MTNKTYYCALGFGDNFFYALGKDALPIPNKILLDNAEHDEDQQHEQQHTTTTCVSLMQIQPNDNVGEPLMSTRIKMIKNAEDDDNDDGLNYSSAENWIQHHLLAQPSSSHSHGKFVTDHLPVLSCGATHTSMIVPGTPTATATVSSSSAAAASRATPIAGDAYIVGTIFGHAHHHLTIQPSRLPLRIVRISSGRRHVLALTEGSTPSSSSSSSMFASSTSSSFPSFASSSSSSPSYGAGVAVSWGAGHFGQLGHGTDITSCLGPRIINRLLPHIVGGKVVEIAAGGLHSAAIVVPHCTTNNNCRRVVIHPSTNGSNNSDNNNNEIFVRESRTFVWGSNRKGQCGIDGGKCATVPEPLPVVSVRRGGADATVTTTSSGEDAPTDHPVDKYVHFEKLSLGRLHTVALTAYGEVFAWGSTSMGRCGQGGPSTSNTGEYTGSTATDRRFVQRPRHVSALRDVVIESIAAGGAHTLALSRGGRVYAWGAGGDGQCGQGHAGNVFSPRVVWGLPPFSGSGDEVDGQHDKNDSCIPHVNSKIAMEVTMEEEALSKALSMSQISSNISVPSESEPESDRVVSIRASGCYSAAITARGEIYTWGYGSGSAIGHPIPMENELPYIPIIEGNQYSIATAAKVFPEGGSEDNIIRDCRCFDTDLNVMLPRRVECIRKLGFHVEDASLGPGHMVVLCSVKGYPDDDENQLSSDLWLRDTNDTIIGGTEFDITSKNAKQGKGKQQYGACLSAQGFIPLSDARPSIVTSNATNTNGDSFTTIESIESTVSENRRRSSGWISRIKPSSRAGKNSLPISSSQSFLTSPESEKKKSFMQKLRKGNAAAGGGAK